MAQLLVVLKPQVLETTNWRLRRLRRERLGRGHSPSAHSRHATGKAGCKNSSDPLPQARKSHLRGPEEAKEVRPNGKGLPGA